MAPAAAGAFAGEWDNVRALLASGWGGGRLRRPKATAVEGRA
jgi:hypothetical protein